MRAARTDANQAEIVHALLQAGCKVTLLHRVGQGCPDLLVARPDKSFAMVEVKDGAKSPSERKLTEALELAAQIDANRGGEAWLELKRRIGRMAEGLMSMRA